MGDADTPKINIHGHIHHHQDLRQRVRIWEQWNVVRFCCLCLPDGLLEGYYTNDDFLGLRGEYGDLILGFAALNVEIGRVDGPDKVTRYRAQGFAGLKVIGNSMPFSDERYYPIYETAQELGMPILFHTGWLADVGPVVSRRLGLSAEVMRPYHLDAVARAFPDLPIIGAHLGWPHPWEALTLIERYDNVYYDFSGGSGLAPHVRNVLSVLMPHPGLETDHSSPDENRALAWFTKLCFATDNPEPSVWVPNSEHIMDRLHIPAETRHRFYYGNAARILGLPQD
jgi:predicted TIM-barrel fold metal-dependent hydrolase